MKNITKFFTRMVFGGFAGVGVGLIILVVFKIEEVYYVQRIPLFLIFLMGLGIPISWALYENHKINKEKIRKQEELDAKALKVKLEREMQLQRNLDSLHIKLANILIYAEKLFTELPNIIQEAENYLKEAEKDFSEKAFSPFWENIFQATSSLAKYKHNIELIDRNADHYQDRTHKLLIFIRNVDAEVCLEKDFIIPSYSFNTDEGILSDSIVKQLNKIVREAQKDFQFAVIYEQVKTNKILIEGFSTLASAIQGMSALINESISQLSKTMNQSMGEIAILIKDQTYEINMLEATVSIADENRSNFENECMPIINDIKKKNKLH